ncbi:MAG: (d)CMP kinase [Chromatiaceae bacterium]|nr:(d)CMP kinase [Gammaproteobacteria bacterium]MCP5312261.1 (d)CMP kinase [Chromatiaceae bacterium]
MVEPVAVIAIDGPSGSGKGTIAQRVADRLGWRVLDSGALYRLVGLATENADIGFEDENKISDLSSKINVVFEKNRILLDGIDVTDRIRTEGAGSNASKVAAMPAVRAALLDWQRAYATPPGLVADGRDMGTTVFPAAGLKIFLTASAAVRAERRYKQLIEKGLPANLAALTEEIEARDARDRNRSVSPLAAASDAILIDSTALGIDEVVDLVLQQARKVFSVSV